MHPKKCSECGSVVEVSSAPVPFEVRGETLLVSGVEHGLCSGCGEVYLSIDSAEQLQVAAIGMSKAAKRLLSSQEIRNLRRSLSLSQAAFEDLLGIGAKSVVRWEKGTVFQSATADRLMRLIRLMPELSGVLSSGELYAPRLGCGSLMLKHAVSRNWSALPARSEHLELVTNGNNAAAA